ncbi:MAG TPA: TonB-dependent receptor plug domain-containing protein, partial [Phenylobacterium sp.]|nr:TonB-dependent receptor plug domain-containing protein [Phenylobacterium sp.]
MLGLAVSMLAPAEAAAQEAAGELATVKVEDTAIDPNPNAQLGVPYKAKTSGDQRRTRPIAETPTTLQVVTKSAIDDAGYSSLSEILDAQPGITLGTGENGNAFGDRYIIRGQEARSDVFVDGLRDPGMTIRESFAVEQVEITKGPSATFAGRGAAGGAVNAITKQANTAFNFGKADLAVGTDDHVRATLDVNHSFGETFAVRGNLLYAREDVPERSPANRERTGLALSGLYSPTDKLTVTVDYYGL